MTSSELHQLLHQAAAQRFFTLPGAQSKIATFWLRAEGSSNQCLSPDTDPDANSFCPPKKPGLSLIGSFVTVS
jgi:hypothetical protein